MERFFLETRTRYFLYRSRAKIPMLYQQIDRDARERIARTLRIKLPFVEADFRERERLPSEHDMLRVVLADLDAAGAIGSVEEPRAYFAGSLHLRWGSWQDFMYLGGRAGHTVLGLGGSMQNVTSVAGAPPPAIAVTGSTVVGAADALRRLLEGEGAQDEDDAGALRWTSMATTRNRGPAEQIEFVARLLLQGVDMLASNDVVTPAFEDLKDRGEFPVVLGSPLYLAYPD